MIKISQYLDFVDLKYKPKKTDLICLFRVEPAKGISMKEAIGRVASESSNGTWSDLTTLKPHIRNIRARAFSIKDKQVKIAYPIELFELGNMPQIMSSIAGNIFGMKALNNLRLEDVQWPKPMMLSFRGPQFGINKIRRFMKIKKRPLTASVPKPKVGMTTAEHVKVCKELWQGGVDAAKDDENLSSQNFNKFKQRAEQCFKIRDKVEKETGERKTYFINVTAETREMLKRAKLVKELGGEFVMLDVLTAGFAAFQTLREECQDLKLAIHIHRAMHASFTRNPKHGISMLVLADIVRLIGGDNLHIGTVVGKLVGTKEEVLNLEDEIEKKLITPKKHRLAENWYSKNPMFAVSSGGLHPGLVPEVMKLLGNDIVLQLGGGIHGHPQGTLAGAKALRQAIDSVMKKVPINEYAKHNLELKTALKKWGSTRPK